MQDKFLKAYAAYMEYYNEKDSEQMPTNLDIILYNLLVFKSQQEEWELDPDFDGSYMNEDEYGSDLMWMISCHPVFKDSPPCVMRERNHEYGTWEAYEDCKECKSRWLLEPFD